MDKNRFDELMTSIQQMDDIVKGENKAVRRFDFPKPKVKIIRERLSVSQEKFALLLGVSRRTVENWEQGRRHPSGPARSLLRIIEADPIYALKTLSV